MRSCRGLRRVAAFATALLLAGCGLFQPFEGVPRAAPPDAHEPGERIAICYNAMFSTPEKIRALAAETCGPGTRPLLVGQDLRLACPLLTPTRATFVCASE